MAVGVVNGEDDELDEVEMEVAAKRVLENHWTVVVDGPSGVVTST